MNPNIQNGTDIDPLATYDYTQFPNYQQLYTDVTYNYDVQNITTNCTNEHKDSKSELTDKIENCNVKENLNENEQTLIKKEIKHKVKKSFLSEKIADSNFPFYGCAVCNISFKLLTDLDKHIITHKNRITSYGLRLKNQMKRKKMRKEQKKLKKLNKTIKKEKNQIEIEIKTEDGYIGDIKTVDYKLTDTEQIDSKSTGCKENNTIPQKDDNLEKMFKCFACQKQFTLSYYLKLHVRSHTDEKPYTCAECGQCFITASKLGRHKKRIHLAIRHQCRICYKFFSRFEYLTKHFDKKHPEDKLEGEPYDYNAILPYLKELEEQLQIKTDPKETEKSEKLWEDWPMEETKVSTDKEIKLIENNTENAITTVVVEMPNGFMDTEVKKEIDSDGYMSDNKDDQDSCSDSDYFPSNTWAASPKIDSPPHKSKRQKQGEPIKCDICEKKISSQSYLQIHMRTHTGEKPYKCYICNRGFITASKMHRHVLTHSDSLDDPAMKLEKNTDVGSDIVKNKKKKVKDTTKPKSKLKKIRPHACEYCHKRFLHMGTLQVHKKSHDGEELVLKCNYCLMKMDNQEALKVHEVTHEGPKPYLCTLCGKTYKKRETMMYHRKHHTTDKEYTCDICSKSFPSYRKLEKHIATHRADQYVVRYECPVCAHMFNTKYHIKMHLVTHQKEGLIVEANRNEVLAMVLQNARRIPKHPESGIKPLPDEQNKKCNICGQIFQHFFYLEEHLKSHGSKIALEDDEKIEEKKHICQICSKSFKLHYYLKLHSFTHTKEKPYICQQCGKGFITRGKLKRHLETHSGLKKYQCHICYKFFTRPSYLRIHVRTIHGTQDNFIIDKQFGLNANGLEQTV
ncbi:PREDICTED: zinc finger protein 91-like [Papilio xuthus]|uniref:Zinc finger protein 91-like n=1 Tax=Papilio xuthus TaxID=66420 RepID=A0AAJ7EES8_PAPXU|nr:PREDICTED: zinc finger protein 91-like [Papilio xuthus]